MNSTHSVHRFTTQSSNKYCTVMIKGAHETLIHCILNHELDFFEQLILSLQIWNELNEMGTIFFHGSSSPSAQPLERHQRLALLNTLETLVDQPLMMGTSRCVQLFLLRFGSSPKLHQLWAVFIEKIVDAHHLPIELGSLSLMLIEHGLICSKPST